MDYESVSTFEQFADRYDNWFERHSAVFQSELGALKKIIPKSRNGLEIGVGSGRFAEALGIKIGIELSKKLSTLARSRNIDVFGGIAEALPFKDQKFDFVLLNTVLCFVENARIVLQEAKRVLKSNGALIIGMIDKNSALGQNYETRKRENPFYCHAHFYSVDEVLALLHEINFKEKEIYQTIFSPLEEIKHPEKIKQGYGEGGFIVISAYLKD